MKLIQDIKYFFLSTDNAIRKIIGINILVFLVTGFVNLMLYLSKADATYWHVFNRALMLPALFGTFFTQPWSIISYMFLHDSFFHILFNMLWLYWIGNILQEYLGNRKLYEAYFAGGVIGGLIYMVSYHVFPAFESSLPYAFAIGASACVLSIVAATATLLPDYTISLLFFGNVKLKWLALISIVLDLISIPNGNAGGHIAHLGGALCGFLYIHFLYKRGGHLVPDKLYSLFKPSSKLKVFSHSKNIKATSRRNASQEEVDAILDKISKSGYDSLTKHEKETLFKASKD